jgi:hypothetical protein
VQALTPEPLEHLEHGRAVEHDERLRHDLAERDRPARERRAREILRVHDPDRVVDRPAADREARQAPLLEPGRDLGRRRRHVEPGHLLPRRHDRARRAVGEPQHAFNHLTLGRHEHAGARALGDEAADLVLRDGEPAVAGQSDEPQQAVGR